MSTFRKLSYVVFLAVVGWIGLAADPGRVQIVDGRVVVSAGRVQVGGATTTTTTTTTTTQPYWTDSSSNSLVARYNFEGVNWTNDLAGANNLTPLGAVSQVVVGTNVNGRVEYAANFPNNIADYFSMASTTLTHGKSNITATAWVYRESYAYTYNTFVGANNGADGWEISERDPSTTVGGFMYLTGGTPYGATPVIALGSWLNVAMTWSAASGNWYVYTNGVQALTYASSGIIKQATKIYLGSSHDIDVNRHFYGKMDDVRIYCGNGTAYTLTAAQLTNLVANTHPTNNMEAR